MAVRESMRNMGTTRGGWRTASALAFGAMLLIGVAGVARAGTPQAIPATAINGCCVCRGTDGGNATAIRSCSDGSKVDLCVTECKGRNADSMAFGYNQTCSQGCAGFPTQNLH
jgi:hypothetical protein